MVHPTAEGGSCISVMVSGLMSQECPARQRQKTVSPGFQYPPSPTAEGYTPGQIKIDQNSGCRRGKSAPTAEGPKKISVQQQMEN